MRLINIKNFGKIQCPTCHEDLSNLNPGLVAGKFEELTDEIPLVYTNLKGPQRLLTKFGGNKILRARLDGKDGSSISFQDNYLIANGFYITPFTNLTCEQSRWIIEDKILKQSFPPHLPEIKLKNRII